MASNKSDAVSKYNFLAEPENALVCGICLEVAEEPRQHEQCGKLLCSECLEKYGRTKPCPNCREENPQYFGDNKSNREIKALGIRCSSADRTCKWEGTVGTLKQHVETCEFALVPCPVKCKDAHDKVEYFMRKNLDEHLRKDCPNRDYTCQYCEEKGTYATITQVHDIMCKKKIRPCLNAECAETMERQKIDEHVRTQCPHTMISCKYKGIGCTTELKRKDMAAHEEDDHLHLHMSLDTVNKLQEAFQKQCQLMMTLKKEFTIFSVTEYQNKKDADKKVSSPSFYTHPYGYHVAVRVYVNGIYKSLGTHVAVSVSILKGNYDAELNWPFSGKVTLTLLNQLEDKNHHTDTFSLTDEVVGSNRGKIEYIRHSALAHDPVKNTQYLVHDTLYFRVSVEVADQKPWLQCTAK